MRVELRPKGLDEQFIGTAAPEARAVERCHVDMYRHSHAGSLFHPKFHSNEITIGAVARPETVGDGKPGARLPVLETAAPIRDFGQRGAEPIPGREGDTDGVRRRSDPANGLILLAQRPCRRCEIL
jgi:hypothetical protein